VFWVQYEQKKNTQNCRKVFRNCRIEKFAPRAGLKAFFAQKSGEDVSICIKIRKAISKARAKARWGSAPNPGVYLKGDFYAFLKKSFFLK
jgi:hypothetical protein